MNYFRQQAQRVKDRGIDPNDRQPLDMACRRVLQSVINGPSEEEQIYLEEEQLAEYEAAQKP
jgi:hypothetical protein